MMNGHHPVEILFLHGLESGPQGAKITALRDAGWRVSAPDCEGIAKVSDRVEIAREALARAAPPVILVGSSFGGLVAALLVSALTAERAAPTVGGVLLLAPALHLQAAAGVRECHPNSCILHGREDDVVPIEASRTFARRFRCELVEVDDGHRLANSHEEILRLVDRTVARIRS